MTLLAPQAAREAEMGSMGDAKEVREKSGRHTGGGLEDRHCTG